MRLPAMAYDIGMTATSQTAFGGLDHTPGAGDGAVYHMKNLTGADYPLLASRPPRWKVATLEQPGGLFARGTLCWVAQGGFWYQGERKGDVSQGEKTFAALGRPRLAGCGEAASWQTVPAARSDASRLCRPQGGQRQ